MDIEAAKRAGELARGIEQRQPMLALLDKAIAEGWLIKEVVAVNPQRTDERSLILSVLDEATSGASLQFIRQVYASQIAALEADLATAESWTPPPNSETGA
jgi:hypothetical protein